MDDMQQRQRVHADSGVEVQLLQGYARQFAQHGVRVNSVLPGWVQTEFIDHLAENAGVRASTWVQFS